MAVRLHIARARLRLTPAEAAVAAGPLTLSIERATLLLGAGSVTVSGASTSTPARAALTLTGLAATLSAKFGPAALVWGSPEIPGFYFAGGLTGIMPVSFSGRNRPGRGALAWDGSGLRWRAPRSSSFGRSVPVDTARSYVLPDGDDPFAFAKVSVTLAALPSGPTEAVLLLRDVVDTAPANWVGESSAGEAFAGGNVEAGSALSGMTAGWSMGLVNPHASLAVQNILAWIDPRVPAAYAASTLQLSWDNSNWFAPTSEAAAAAGMSTASASAASTRTLYLRKIISAAAPAALFVPFHVHIAFDDGAGGRAYNALRGGFRVANAAEYRFYRKEDSDPIPGSDAPYGTASSLPATPASTFADGDWRVGMTYFNGYVESGLSATKRIVVSSSAQAPTPPSGPLQVDKYALAGGVVRIVALYDPERDGDLRADEWALWYTTDGSAPGGGSPDYTEAMTFNRAHAVLRYDLPAQTDGTEVRVLVRTRRSGTASENASSADATARTAGPSVSAGGSKYGSGGGYIGTEA